MGTGWLTPLIGRTAELAEVARLLARHRLLTLTGAGGVGKTRLAVAAMQSWGSAGSVVSVLVDLAALQPSDDPPERLEPAASAIGRAVAATVSAGAQSTGPPLDGIARQIGGREALLVLDNCEHLAVTGTVCRQLLSACPGLRVLATSRRPLGLDGETVWVVPPLAVPARDAPDVLNAVLEADAGRLFLERAQRSLPSFALTATVAPAVAEICRQLDGLPLALELAAARVRILAPQQILDGLADSFRLLTGRPASGLERHRSLEASLDWSYDLIDDHARTLLRLLSIAVEWSLETIRTAWAADGPLLDALGTLVDAGLLITIDEGDALRYRLLETVRSYALRQLRAAGEERAVRRAHLRHFRALAADADRLLEHDAGRRQLELESVGLRDALEFAITEDPSIAVAMGADLRHWLLVAGNSSEALTLCLRLLEADAEPAPVARAHLLFCAAQLAVFEQDYPRAQACAEEALPLANASGDDGAIGVGLMLASVAQRSTNPIASAQLGRQSVALLTRAGDRHGLVLAVAQLAMTEALRDRFVAVREACAEFASLTAGQPPSWLAVWLEIALAWADLGQGDPRSALAHSERGIELEGGRPTYGQYVALAYKLEALTLIGEAERALEIGTSALEQSSRDGVSVSEIIEPALGRAELALGKLDAARGRAQQRFGDAHFAAAANAHQLLARIALAERQPRALRSHAAALRATGQHAGNDRLEALANWVEGAAALIGDELEPANARLHEALTAQIDSGFRSDVIDTLEALAELQVRAGHGLAGGRILGGALRARAELELCRLPPRANHFADLQERGEQLVGTEAWASALEDGRGLTPDEVLEYAQRGRGRHIQGQHGLASLTPTEHRVARAAADGLTNATIATKLLMSHGTVKAHLAHVYRKLEVANRVELATLLQRQSSAEVDA